MLLTTNNKTFLFTLLAGAQLLTQTSGQVFVEDEYEYGAPITVTFDYFSLETQPRGTDYLGLYKFRPNGDTRVYMWSDTCGRQESWNDPDQCDPPPTNSITFTAEDPNLEDEGDYQWPLPKGNYKACLMEYLEEDDDVEMSCTDFIIKPIPKGWKCETSIIPHDTTYTASDDLQVSFSFTSLPILNTWIGIYKSADLPTEKGALIDFEPIDWTYAGCDSKEGDQEENDDCSVAVSWGTKTFDLSNSTYYPNDEYVFCIVYDNNSPYREFKCSDEVVLQD